MIISILVGILYWYYIAFAYYTRVTLIHAYYIHKGHNMWSPRVKPYLCAVYLYNFIYVWKCFTASPIIVLTEKFLDGTFFGKKLHRVWCGTIFCSSCTQSFTWNKECYHPSLSIHRTSRLSQQSLFNPILFRSKYVIIRDCIPDPWSERNKK